MTCTELELLLCEYIDGTLPASERKPVELHLGVCPECAEMARDSASMVEFVSRVADVEPPPSLVTKILQQVPTSQPPTVKARSLFGRLVRRVLEPVLQPRLVMGMAMTILSFAMLGRFAGIEARQLRAADLSPVKVWEASEDRAHRVWNRAVKYYQSLRVVYEVQSVLRELTENDEESESGAAGTVTPQQSPSAAPRVENPAAPK
jgi:anti-sigma factor RsiW